MLPREWIRRIREMEVKTRLISQQLLAGNNPSIFRGRGMDFDDVRPYQAGDDVRRIDWNVTARMQMPYVKRYMEEREMTFQILVDISASGTFSSTERSKRELAAELAGTLAFSAHKSNDRVGAILFTDRVEKLIPPGKGSDHVMHLIRQTLFHKPVSTGTSIERALHHLNKIQTRPSVVFIVSDFFDSGFERALSITNLRHSVAAFVLTDPRDFELPDVGWVTLRDPESGELLELNTGDRGVRSAFAASAAERSQKLKRRLRRSDIRFIEVPTNRPYVTELANFLQVELARKLT